MAPHSALARALNEFFSRDDLFELLWGSALSLARNVLVPLAVALLIVGGSIHLVRRLLWYLIPPSPKQRYDEAKEWYRHEMISEALAEWKQLDDYAPAYLSRACHELYVLRQPQQALDILEHTQKLTLDKATRQSVEGMQLDAKAVAKGNHVMVKLNAAIAKEDYLGIHA